MRTSKPSRTPPQSDPIWDAIVVGGGPAGLSAALVLGRCRRRVLVFDGERARNASSRAAHGFLSRDGCPPEELRRIAREQLAPYGVMVRAATVETVARRRDGFELILGSGERYVCRKLLLATGLVDVLPEIPGLAACFGRSVFTCPYCDAWEVRDEPIAVLGEGRGAVELALALTAWSGDVVLCTHGASRLRPDELELLSAHGVPWRRERVAQLEAREGQLQRVIFEHGAALERTALFVHTHTRQHSELARSLGCEFNGRGEVKCGQYATAGPDLYVAGDASLDANFIAVAAAEGTKAGVAIHKSLREEHSKRLLAQQHDVHARRA